MGSERFTVIRSIGSRLLLDQIDCRMETVGETSRLFLIELDDESSATFKRDAHDQASCLFRDLHWAITSSRFHRCHAVTPVAIPKRVGRNS